MKAYLNSTSEERGGAKPDHQLENESGLSSSGEPQYFRRFFQKKLAFLGVLAATSLLGAGCKGCHDRPSRQEKEARELKLAEELMPKITFQDQSLALRKPESLQSLSDDQFIQASEAFSQRAEAIFQKELAPVLRGDHIIQSLDQRKAIEKFLSDALHIVQSIPEFQGYLSDPELQKNYLELSTRLAPLFLAGGYYFAAHPAPFTLREEGDPPDTVHLEFFFSKITSSHLIKLQNNKGFSVSMPTFTLSKTSPYDSIEPTVRYDGNFDSSVIFEEGIQNLIRDGVDDPLVGPFLMTLDEEERAELTASLHESFSIQMASLHFFEKRFPELAKPGIIIPTKVKIKLAPGVTSEIEDIFLPLQIYDLGTIGIELYHQASSMPLSFISVFERKEGDFPFLFTSQVLPLYLLQAAPPSKAKDDLIEAEKRNHQKITPLNTQALVQLFLETFTPEDRKKLALKIYKVAYNILDQAAKTPLNPDLKEEEKEPIEL